MLVKEVKISDALTYGDWMERFKRLNEIKDLSGEKILYARSKNLMKLRRFHEANSMESRIPITSEFRKFQGELNSLRSKHSIPSPQGTMVDINKPEYIDGLDKLQKKYKDAIDERERDFQAYSEFMREVVPQGEIPEIYTTINDATKELSQEQVDAIWWFVSEKVEEVQ